MMKICNSMAVGGFSFKCLFVWLLFFTISVPLNSVLAQADEECKKLLEEAEKKYYDALFDDAIGLIKGCLDKEGLSKSTEFQAYKLLSLSYQGKSYEQQAKEAIKQLLKLNPSYKPNTEQEQPEFVEMVEKVRKEIEPPPTGPQPGPQKEKGGGISKWVWIGGGVVAAGVVTAVVLSGGGDETPPPPPGQFPLPPGRP